MLKRALNLQGQEHLRLLPFFGVYFLLFAALTLADGLSLSLFVQRVGAAALPRYYGFIAVATLLVNGAYVLVATRIESSRLFSWLALASGAAFLVAWLGMLSPRADTLSYGLLFVSREISYTLFLMHFGTFLQEYFTRRELVRVMPIVYAGGRVGGIAGGLALERLSPSLGLLPLVLVCAAVIAASGLGARAIAHRMPKLRSAEDLHGDSGLVAGRAASAQALDEQARASLGGFLRFLYQSPLMFWNTITSLVYVACRWVLNFQYNGFFERHFDSDLAMAAFLGRYSQIALLLALVLQMFLVSRLVSRFGIRGTQLGYASLVCVGFGLNASAPSLPAAVFSRFLETELRFGLRNPLNQLIINKFSKPLRIRVRAFGIGFLTPTATFATSALLLTMTATGPILSWLGVLLGAGYFAAIIGINRSFHEPMGAAAPAETAVGPPSNGN